MEYLMTYGWAILVIAVVLGALYSLGIFNGANFLGGSCVAAPGYLCTNPTLGTGGILSFTFGYQGPNVTIVGFACTNSSAAPSTFIASGSSSLLPGQEESVSTLCPIPSTELGTRFSGYLWVEYDQAGKSDLIAQISSIATTITTQSYTTSSNVITYGSGEGNTIAITMDNGDQGYFCAYYSGQSGLCPSFHPDIQGYGTQGIGHSDQNVCTVAGCYGDNYGLEGVGIGVPSSSSGYTELAQASITSAPYTMSWTVSGSTKQVVILYSGDPATFQMPSGCYMVNQVAFPPSTNWKYDVYVMACPYEVPGTYSMIVDTTVVNLSFPEIMAVYAMAP